LPRLASNFNPPDFHILSSWDYRCVPSCPAFAGTLNQEIFFALIVNQYLLTGALTPVGCTHPPVYVVKNRTGNDDKTIHTQEANKPVKLTGALGSSG
jgi:hypothetical protein